MKSNVKMVVKDTTNEKISDMGTIDNTLPPVHYLHELPKCDEERLEKLFIQLDRDGNGKIDIHDLSEELKKFGLSHQYAEVR